MENLDQSEFNLMSFIGGIIVGLFLIASPIYIWQMKQFTNYQHTYLVSKKDGIVDIKQNYKTRDECLEILEDRLKNGPIQDQIQCVTIKGNVL